ncbi:hypothetical protein GXW82_11855 [Streptacidiphilus sp. 4-A2]|nr:hypothetical protein [Streptacidiphilus sp. 4-A2]
MPTTDEAHVTVSQTSAHPRGAQGTVQELADSRAAATISADQLRLLGMDLTEEDEHGAAWIRSYN